MTDEEIVQILGKGDKPVPTGGVAGCGVFIQREYDKYGFSVNLFSDSAGVLRTESVIFQPLSGEERRGELHFIAPHPTPLPESGKAGQGVRGVRCVAKSGPHRRSAR
jgi:hypothetical protein